MKIKNVLILILFTSFILPIFLYTSKDNYIFLNEVNDRFFKGNKFLIDKIDSFIYEIDITRPIKKIFIKKKIH